MTVLRKKFARPLAERPKLCYSRQQCASDVERKVVEREILERKFVGLRQFKLDLARF
jgi:hypothetical protein